MMARAIESRFLDSIAKFSKVHAPAARGADAMISGTSRASLMPRIMFIAVGAACMALSYGVSSAGERVTAGPSFSGEELKIILSHGPWPAPVAHDPSNRVSGKPDAIELGTLL